MSQTTAVACAGCGTENPGGARFCMGCGGSLEVGCPSCGTALPPAAKFCFNCGHEIEAGATADDAGQSAQEVASSIASQLREITAGTGERRTITMMFCDVKDSTATAERLDPEAWSDIMRATMSAFVEPVERYGGTVARLLGDAILAYFGAPVAHEDDPQRALLAALAILDNTRELTARVREQHGTDFAVRIGVNTGLVVVGDVGSDTFGEYAALGDAANVAARMEQTAEPGTIRIAEPTHKLIAPLFDTEPVGTIEVKGRAEPVRAHTVLRARGAPGQVRGITGLSAPLVGRERELRQLVDAVHAVRDGGGCIVSLVGEAGLGKSRLVTELRGAIDEEVHWITGQCYSYEDATPYAPFVPALTECFHLAELDEPTARTRRVLDTMTDLVDARGHEHGRYLCALLGLPLEADDQHALRFADPGTHRERTFDAVATLFTALAEREPVVLELEDLHWADPTSIELVQHLLPLTERARILLLLLFRPRRDEPSWEVHELASRQHAHRYTPVTLAPLGDDDSRELVAHLLRVEGLSDSVRETILRKAEGNPFFVEEVIRSLLDDGTIVRDSGRFVATTSLEDLRVPDTLSAVLTTRLDRLPPEARSVVQTAAVLGREFPREMLDLLADPAVDLDAVLTDLKRREIVVEARRGNEVVLSFKHALTRDTAYDTLLLSVRRDLHRIVGKLIEERHPDRVFDLAWHFTEADEPLKAVPYLVAAGEQAFAAFARADAVRHFRRALALWDDSHDVALARTAFEGSGNALMFLGQMAESVATFERMLSFARDHADPVGEVSALNKGGMVALMSGDVEGAEQRMLEARALAEERNHQTGLAEFHVGFCYLNVSQGRLDRAEEALGEAAEVCLTLDMYSRNFGLTHFAAALVYQVKFDDARAAVARAKEQAGLDDDFEHLSDLEGVEAMIELFTGDPVRARERAEVGLAMATEVGASIALPTLAWMAGASQAQMGDLEAAASSLQIAIESGMATGLTGASAAAHVLLGGIDQVVHGPATERAQDRFDRARELYGQPLTRAHVTAVHAALGVNLIAAGRLDEAQGSLDAALAVPSAMSKLVGPELPLCRGGIALARGDVADAERFFQEAQGLIEAHGLDLFAPRTRLGLAIVAASRGQTDAAIAGMHAAEDDAVGRSMRLDTLQIQRTAAHVLQQAGAQDEAAGFRERCQDTVADIASQLTDPELRRAFLRTNATAS